MKNAKKFVGTVPKVTKKIKREVIRVFTPKLHPAIDKMVNKKTDYPEW